MDGRCAFTYHDYILGTIYVVFWLMSTHNIRGMCRPVREKYVVGSLTPIAESHWCLRIFFVALSFQCMSRASGFFLSPIYLPCSRDLLGMGPSWLDILFNLPAMFEVSTFSALILVFASSYHLILNRGDRGKKYFQALGCTIVTVNLVCYILLATAFFTLDEKSDRQPHTKGYMVAMIGIMISSGSVGLIFVAYGLAILRIYYSVFLSNSYTPGVFRRRTSYDTIPDNPDSEAGGPLIRMTALALVCAICFLGRCILLILRTTTGFNVQYCVYSSAAYFVLGEVIPISVLFVIFHVRMHSSAENTKEFDGAIRKKEENSDRIPRYRVSDLVHSPEIMTPATQATAHTPGLIDPLLGRPMLEEECKRTFGKSLEVPVRDSIKSPPLRRSKDLSWT
ncbi:hypothetical protein AAMO2058_001578900 [Amorphochlora amoebiformis]